LPTGTIDVGYDGQGRLASVSAPSGAASSFGYDGPLPTSITTTGPVPGTIGFGYDSDLGPAALTIDSEAPIAFGYDADGLLTSAGDLALTRNAATGFLETTTLGTTADSRTYTPYGELDTWTGTVGGSPAYSFDLDRDAAGRITTRTETLGGTTHVLTYTYDPDRGWLTEVKQDDVVVESYGYDGNGNRTSWTDFWGSGTASYDDQDRLLTAGAATYTYTPNGELLTKTQGSDVTTYAYDVRGALLGVTLPTGVQVDYLVDASGRRIGKKVDGTLVEGYLYAGGISPVAETDGAGNVTAVFVYATKGNVPDYIVEAGATYRVFTDHLGSVRMVVNVQSGAVLQQIDYDAFGRITFDSNPGVQPFGFAGGLYDPQTGLVRFGARDYDPEVGRWTAKDPVGFGGGDADLYNYLSSNPVSSTDPSGLCEDPGGPPGSVRICMDAFISTFFVPSDTGDSYFALALGDNRGFESTAGGGYRTRTSIIFDPATGSLTANTVPAVSEILLGLYGRQGTVTLRRNDGRLGNVRTLRLRQEALNGFGDLDAPGVPKNTISSDLTFLFDQGGRVGFYGMHDAYPSFEIYVYRDGEPARTLYQFNETNIRSLQAPMNIWVVRSEPIHH
jgi:RHS repeat-associated protein